MISIEAATFAVDARNDVLALGVLVTQQTLLLGDAKVGWARGCGEKKNDLLWLLARCPEMNTLRAQCSTLR